MGIYEFTTWLDKYKSEVKTSQKPRNVGCLFFDMNGIIHNAAQLVYCYGKGTPEKVKEDYKRAQNFYRKEELKEQLQIQEERFKNLPVRTVDELELEMFQEVFKIVFELIQKIRPSQYVVMAVDGVAPMAKITQQRSRRYKGALEEKSGSYFDSTKITPGTEFMFALDNYLKKAIAENIKAGTLKFGRDSVKNIVYSSHLTPGEGEHKFFDFIRSGQIVPDPDLNHIIYGLDADLLMLSTLSSMNNLYLSRESLNDFIHVDAFRKVLVREMNPVSPQIGYQDFIIMFFLIGNDFLPRVMSLSNTHARDGFQRKIEKMLQIYNELGTNLTDEEGQIMWHHFTDFLTKFAKYEKDFVDEISTQKFENPIEAIEKARTVVKGKSYINFDIFHDSWYQKVFSPRSTLGKELFGNASYVSEEKIFTMCMEYFRGIQWTLRYYMNGQSSISTKYIYQYHHAPLLTDLAQTLSYLEPEDYIDMMELASSVEDPVITPIHQLMCVIPPKSQYLIPQPYRTLMTTRFKDLCPTEFDIDMEGKGKYKDAYGKPRDDGFQATPILSIADPVRITKETEDYPVPEKYQIQRNAKFVKVFDKPKVPYVPQNFKLFDYNKKVEKKFEQEEVDELEQLQLEGLLEPIIEKVEPKSPAQIRRIVEGRVKDYQEKKVEKKKMTSTFNWTNTDLM